MVYYPLIDRIQEESVKELWLLRDFQEKYHPELTCTRLSTQSDDMNRLNKMYVESAKYYIKEVKDGPLKINIII